MGRRSKEQETIDRFVDLRAQGKLYEDIAKELNVDEPTLIAWSQRYELEIGNLRAIRYEAIQTKALATKEKRAEIVGSRIDAIKRELEKRDLSALSTKDLEELLIKYTALQDKFREGVTFTLQDLDLDFARTKTWNG